MAASISQQLEDLLNPLPNFVDPEDDEDEETKAKVVEKFDEGEDDEESASGHLRKRAVSILADSDRRYRGKATSRKLLQKELDGSDDDEELEDDDNDDEENEIVDKYMKMIKDVGEEEDDIDKEDDDDDDEDEENDEEDEDQDDNDDEEDLIANDSPEMSSLVSKLKDTDFMKLTEGMDDLGDSEDEEDSAKGDEEEGESEEDSEEEEESSLRTFSKEKVDEEVEKGIAVKNQLALWDLMLEGRIKMQKALVTANQLPQSQTFPDFKTRGGSEYAEALKNSHKALKALQRSLLELQDQLLYQNPETRGISQGKTWSANSKDKDDEEINSEDDEENMNDDDEEEKQKTGRNGPPKRKLEMAEYPSFMAKRFAAFQPYRDATLQKWYDKTRLTMGKTNKGFGAFERNILTQVEQVLMDKERLVRRTQTRRSQYRVLGKPEPITPEIDNTTITEGEAAELALKANTHLKDLDEEIFDDDDFYHQLLRELIERKTSAADPNDQVAMGRQWLAIQKLRSKIKKKVDTKASKGRKIRFHIHSKLVNFMAPFDNSGMSDDARSELYRSLFANAPVTAH